MRRRFWGFAVASLVATAAVFACVGSDPGAGALPESDGGGGDETLDPRDDSGGGTDAGTDACPSDLTNDPRNCGACGHDCSFGACNSSTCQPWVLTRLDAGSPVGPGTDGTNVYFGVAGQGVWRVQVDGGSMVQMSSGLEAQGFANGPSGMLACGTLGGVTGIYSLPTTPGVAPTSVNMIPSCFDLVADGTTLWAGRTTSIDQVTGVVIAQHSLAPFGERLTGGMDVNNGRLYWANQNSGIWNVSKTTVDAGRAVLNTSLINEAHGLAVTDRHAYVTARPAGAGGLLLRVDLDGGGVDVLLTTIPQPLTNQGVARSNGALYFTAGDTMYGFVPP